MWACLKVAHALLLLLGLFLHKAAASGTIFDGFEPREELGPSTATYMTEHGPVFGSVGADDVNVFRSVPYARGPTGHRRWSNPERPQRWTQPLNVSSYADPCTQRSGNKTIGKEDCLKLYLYTTSAPQSKHRKPVMVWIHGGGLQSGNGYLSGGNSTGGFYDGRKLALLGDVVVVAIQYRLGTLGFLAMSDGEGGFGNFGLKDQRLGLQWVQKNVGYFGGDPSNVMVFGESAGGISMCYHLTSPASHGLFRHLAMESGSCNMQVQTLEAGLQMAKSFGEMNGCREPKLLKACLSKLHPHDLVYPTGNETTVLPGNDYWVAPSFPWCMTIDGTEQGVLAPAISRLERGRFNRVNVIFGSNTNEFQCACSGIGADVGNCLFANTLPHVLPQLKAPYSERDLHLILNHFLQTEVSQDHFKQALALYPASRYANKTSRLSAMLVDTTGWIGSCATQKAAEFIARHHRDIWMYHFARLGNESTVGHFAEVPYVFQNCDSCGKPHRDCCQGTVSSRDDAVLSATMGRYWTSFARQGNPNAGGLLHWPRYTGEGRAMMRFDTPRPRLQQHYRAAQCRFWDRAIHSPGRL